eukprot:GHVU01137960.1.p1 GENE.GHVU01137960.1~~GHVU01137960.1.p1  ORF type:complete len:146 (+),score=9.03 GHVU01137960.1:110-547(+)
MPAGRSAATAAALARVCYSSTETLSGSPACNPSSQSSPVGSNQAQSLSLSLSIQTPTNRQTDSEADNPHSLYSIHPWGGRRRRPVPARLQRERWGEREGGDAKLILRQPTSLSSPHRQPTRQYTRSHPLPSRRRGATKDLEKAEA